MSHRSTREATVPPHLMLGGEELQWAQPVPLVTQTRCPGCAAAVLEMKHIALPPTPQWKKRKEKKRDKRNEKGADEKEKKQKKKKKENKMF